MEDDVLWANLTKKACMMTHQQMFSEESDDDDEFLVLNQHC